MTAEPPGDGPTGWGATAEPPPDFAERMAARRAAWRARRPVAAARMARAQRVALWLAIPWAILAAVVVPGGGEGIAVTAGLLWLLLQVFLLCRSKSLSWTAYARTFSLSALFALPIGAVEIGIAALAGWSPSDQAASVVIAGPVEEVLKLAPLGCVIWLAANRARRMGVADHLLLGMAAGAGFQLMEDVIRRVVTAARDLTPFQELLAALLDSPDASTDYDPIAFFPGGSDVADAHFAGHGVMTALVAAGIGFAIRLRPRLGPRAWLLPAALWLLAVADHVGFNYEVTEAARGLGEGDVVALPGWLAGLHGLWGGGSEAGLLLFVLLVTAVVTDYRSVRRVEDRLPPVAPRHGLARRVHALAERAGGRAATGIHEAAEALSRIAGERALLVGAAARGPRVWLAAMPWLRERRELAFGLDRAGDGPRRSVPDAAALAARGTALRAALAGAAAVLALALGSAAVLSTAAEPAFLAGLLEDLGSWWDGLSGMQQLAAVLGLASLLAIGGMGFLPALGLVTTLSAAAEHGRGLGALVRDPQKRIRDFVRDLTPGEAAAYVLGLVLERLLRGAGGRLAKRFGPRRATDDAGPPDGAAAPPRPRSTTEDAGSFRSKASPSTAELEKAIEETTRQAKPAGTDTHHIVPKGAYVSRRARNALYQAQARLERAGVGPDDAGNGVFLPRAEHRPIHTDAYFRQLDRDLARAGSDPARVRATLERIRTRILDGDYP